MHAPSLAAECLRPKLTLGVLMRRLGPLLGHIMGCWLDSPSAS